MSLDDLVQVARRNIEALDPLVPDGTFWTNKRIELRQHILYDDLRCFTEWPMIVQTMLVGSGASYFSAERDLVRSWHKNNYEAICRANHSEIDSQIVGFNMVHTAHHLAAWEMITGCRVPAMRSIAEFGGGFGAMRLAISNHSFGGRYYMYDYPEFLILQSFYLAAHGIFVDTPLSMPQPVDLVIATWSLTEAPAKTRDRFMENYPAKHYLIAFMPEWDGVDNWEWLSNQPQLNDCQIVGSPAPNSFYAVK